MTDQIKKVEAPESGVDKTLIKNLFEGTDIPQAKQDEFVSIFEAAVKVESKKVSDAEIEKATTELKEKVEEYTEYVREEYATKLDEYLDYSVSKWLEENKLAVTNGVKAEQFDSLMGALKKLFEEHSMTIPEDKVNVVAEQEEKIKAQDNEINELKKQIIAQNGKISAMEKAKSIAEATSSLAVTEKEKVVALAEELVYDETFGSKLSTIIESVKVVPPVKTETDDVTPQYIPEKKTEVQPTEVKRRKFNPDVM